MTRNERNASNGSSIDFGVDFSVMGEAACELSATMFDCYIDILKRANIQGDTDDEIRGAKTAISEAVRLARNISRELRSAVADCDED